MNIHIYEITLTSIIF